MEKELGADVIKTTQSSLGKYVKRPPLSEKLLKKPPFRFLHDIVSAVLKTTGFFEGLFEEEELISENVKDRESKILFLNKVIFVTCTTTGKSLGVKSTKIVAGQEPDKTNELLQCLASALDKKLSSDEAVKKYKESVKSVPAEVKQKEVDLGKTSKKGNDTKKLKSNSNEKLTTNKIKLGAVVNKSVIDSKTKKSENNGAKPENHSKKPQVKDKSKPAPIANASKAASIELKENVENIIQREDEIKENKEAHQTIVPNNTENIKNDEQTITTKRFRKKSAEEELHGTFSSSNTTGENDLNSSFSSQDLTEAKSIVQHIDKVENTEDDTNTKDPELNVNNLTNSVKESKILPSKSIVNSLSRDDSTDITEKSNNGSQNSINNDKVASISSSRKNTDVIRPLSVRPSSSRPGAPRLREKIDNVIPDNDNLLLAKVNIIAENTNNEDDEDTSVIVLEQHTNEQTTLENQQNQMQLSSMEHGHLVQQILDTQKEFSQVGKTEIEWQFGAQKVKDAVNQEIEQMRFNIQALSRVANPLGKLLDHIQEDVEVMRQELQQWTKVYDEVSKEMQIQKMANDETLVPLQTRIKQLDVDTQEKRDKIDDLKILIHKNASRIEKLLTNGNVQ